MLNRLSSLVPARRVAKGLGRALLCGVFGLFGATASAQDVVFSQFYANPLYLNPALAGNAFDPRLTFNFRNQWPALNASFVTYSAGFDQHFDALSGGIGLHVLTDQIGSEAFQQIGRAHV